MADVLDYKKAYKELYFPKDIPAIINVPEIIFVAVDGKGDPNDKDGEFGKAVELLYSIQYTIKMSKKRKIHRKDILIVMRRVHTQELACAREL